MDRPSAGWLVAAYALAASVSLCATAGANAQQQPADTLLDQRLAPALAKFDRLVETTRRGRDFLLSWQAQMTPLYQEAEAASDPLAAEIERRFADGQTYRAAAFNPESVAYLTSGLSPGDADILRTRIREQTAAADIASTDWLQKKIAERGGWFRNSEIGEKAANMAFVLVQHADRTPGFQRQVLALMAPLLAQKEIRPQNYAMLWDRVASREGRPQRYGSQGDCQGTEWRPHPVEAADGLDQRRAEVGLQPMNDYTAMMQSSCRQP